MLKDCMTRCGFWKDDAQVVREHVEKKWSEDPVGIEIEITELEKERKANHIYRPLTYIVSPYAGDILVNVEAARRYCRFAVDQGRIPLCSHLLYPQFLRDDDPEERELRLFFGKILMDPVRRGLDFFKR